MKIETSDLKLIAMVVNEPGFRLVEKFIHDKHLGYNNINAINGNPFHDGLLAGKAESFAEIINMIGDIRLNIKSMEKE
jgi:TPP-dependent 2-oxoacid decarboxylase